MMDDLKNIIESLLFVSETPLSINRIKSVVEEADTKIIREAVNALTDEYAARGGAFFLREAGGGFQICTRPKYSQWVKRLLQLSPHRLSKPALETLAIVAYNQPIIRSDIEHIRGVDCGGTLRTLLERKLIRVLGHKDIPGRPLIYATTNQFLEVFDLKDLKDLPSVKEIEELGPSDPELEAPAQAADLPVDQKEDQTDTPAPDDAAASDTPDAPAAAADAAGLDPDDRENT